MDTFAVLLEMPVRRRFATPLRVKGEKRRFIHEAEDFVVFSPHLYKSKKIWYPYEAVELLQPVV
jgi:hypothetical protein